MQGFQHEKHRDDHRRAGRAALVACLMLGACTTTPKPALIIPDTLRKPCEPASVGKLETQGDLDALVIRQEGALQTCDKAKAAVIEIVDAHGKAAKPKRWWPF